MLFKNNKNLFIALFGIFILFFVGGIALAEEGLVPCTGADCGVNDFLVLIGNVVNFIYTIIPFVAVILIIWGGIVFLTSKGEPDKVKKGKQILLAVAIGLLIVYGARFIIVSFMTALGGDTSWFESIIE